MQKKKWRQPRYRWRDVKPIGYSIPWPLMERLALERRDVLSMHEYLLFKTNARDIDHTSDVPSLQFTRFGFCFLFEHQDRTTSASLGGLGVHPVIVL